MYTLNETHDPGLQSWVESANEQDADFPIQNLPFGVLRRKGSNEAFRCAVAIGDQALDLGAAYAAGVFKGGAAEAAALCSDSKLNRLMALNPAAWSALRLALSRLLRRGNAQAGKLAGCLVPRERAEHDTPAVIGDYTDFFSSLYHATAAIRLFRPNDPLTPNYKWVPIAYHGRSSSIRVSGRPLQRPLGQKKTANEPVPSFGPSERLDYELELGIFVGSGNALGSRIPIGQAENHLFGLCLLNDWSARDIQSWESQPLGPFLAKNFATTISPWIVTLEALAPFRAAWTRAPEDPQPLEHLESAENRACGAIDIQLEVRLETSLMRETGSQPARLSRTSSRHAYWTIGQMVAHHTSNGCNLLPGDLFGSGTQSGPDASEAGSLLELSQGGRVPFRLPNGEMRGFLEDGDAVIMRGWCEREGFARIGFGECAGTILPASH